MTDEEMAKEFANTGYALGCTKSPFEVAKEGFLAGLKAGKDMAEADLATVEEIENDIEVYQECMRNEEELLVEEMERQRIANYDFEYGDVKY